MQSKKNDQNILRASSWYSSTREYFSSEESDTSDSETGKEPEEESEVSSTSPPDVEEVPEDGEEVEKENGASEECDRLSVFHAEVGDDGTPVKAEEKEELVNLAVDTNERPFSKIEISQSHPSPEEVVYEGPSKKPQTDAIVERWKSAASTYDGDTEETAEPEEGVESAHHVEWPPYLPRDLLYRRYDLMKEESLDPGRIAFALTQPYDETNGVT